MLTAIICDKQGHDQHAEHVVPKFRTLCTKADDFKIFNICSLNITIYQLLFSLRIAAFCKKNKQKKNKHCLRL